MAPLSQGTFQTRCKDPYQVRYKNVKTATPWCGSGGSSGIKLNIRIRRHLSFRLS